MFISVISRTGTWQINDVTEFDVNCRPKKYISKWLTIFNVLHYLTSLLLAACECATVNVHMLNMYTESGYMPPVHFLCNTWLFVSSFKPRQLYTRRPLNSKIFGLSFLFAWFGQDKNLLCLLGTETRLFGFIDFCVKLSRERAYVTLTSLFSLFSSNMLTQQLKHTI
jgi:hypothetical protein